MGHPQTLLQHQHDHQHRSEGEGRSFLAQPHRTRLGPPRKGLHPRGFLTPDAEAASGLPKKQKQNKTTADPSAVHLYEVNLFPR